MVLPCRTYSYFLVSICVVCRIRMHFPSKKKKKEDPFESAASSPAPSASPASHRSPTLAGDFTLPHIDPQDVAAATPAFPAVTPPSMRSLLEALLAKDQDDYRALDEAATSLLRDLAAKLASFVSLPALSTVDTMSSLRSGSAPAHFAPKASVAVQSADPITKPPSSPPPRPPRSPTRPSPRVAKPPPARKPVPAKQSYAKVAASAPAAPATTAALPKAPAPRRRPLRYASHVLGKGRRPQRSSSDSQPP